MENKYVFQDNYLGVSDSKIHLLRNRFEYDAINYQEIDTIVYKKGKAIKNWVLLFVLSLGLLFLGLNTTKNIIEFFFSETGGQVYIEEIGIAFFATLLGSYAMYQSLKKEKILEINNNTKKNRFSLGEFEKNGELNSLLSFLANKCTLQNEID